MGELGRALGRSGGAGGELWEVLEELLQSPGNLAISQNSRSTAIGRPASRNDLYMYIYLLYIQIYDSVYFVPVDAFS